MDINAVTTSYARWAPIYDKTFGAVTNVGRRRTVQYLNQHGPKVLEVGVGTGLALRAYNPDMQVTGIDFSEDMLAKAARDITLFGRDPIPVALVQLRDDRWDLWWRPVALLAAYGFAWIEFRDMQQRQQDIARIDRPVSR